MSDNEIDEKFDLDDKRAEIVPAIRKGKETSSVNFKFQTKKKNILKRMRIRMIMIMLGKIRFSRFFFQTTINGDMCLWL